MGLSTLGAPWVKGRFMLTRLAVAGNGLMRAPSCQKRMEYCGKTAARTLQSW
jgi:hypothetical protein